MRAGVQLGMQAPLLSSKLPQAGDVRTSIGSGLLQLGLQPGKALGLYSVNCKGVRGCMGVFVCARVCADVIRSLPVLAR